MAIYHKHHIIPKHAGGTDEPSNLISLTIEEHAKAHKILWEEHGRWQDWVAYATLSKAITGEEARILSVKFALTGKQKSDEHRKKLSILAKTRVRKKGYKSKPASPQRKAKQSLAMVGRFVGEKNSQYGTMWITNGIVNKKCQSNDIIPNGWRRGRVTS